MASLIEYLELGDGRYIINDKVIQDVTDTTNCQYLTWDELWAGVYEDMHKIEKYINEHRSKD